MWHPEAGWRRLGAGPLSAGVWLASEGGRDVVVKRLARPSPVEDTGVNDPADVNYWRRGADVALSGAVDTTPGLRGPRVVGVEEDDEGITVVHEHVAAVVHPGLWLAACLGRFAGAPLPPAPWLARGQLRSRLALVARRGGWTSLARTQAGPAAEELWRRRSQWLEVSDQLPQVSQHGDPVPANVPGRHGEDGVAVDWAHLGTAPVGADLGYLSLSTREELEPLVDAYVQALPAGLASRDQVLVGARTTAVYTALTRLDWALSRVATGDHPVESTFSHPSVSPYIRGMQRQLPHIEALLA